MNKDQNSENNFMLENSLQDSSKTYFHLKYTNNYIDVILYNELKNVVLKNNNKDFSYTNISTLTYFLNNISDDNIIRLKQVQKYEMKDTDLTKKIFILLID